MRFLNLFSVTLTIFILKSTCISAKIQPISKFYTFSETCSPPLQFEKLKKGKA